MMLRLRGRVGLRGRVVASFLVLLALAELVSVLVFHQVGTTRIAQAAERDLTVATEDLRIRLVDAQPQLGRPEGTTVADVFEQFLRARPVRGDQAFLAFVDGRPFATSAGSPVPLDQLPEAAVWAALTESVAGELATEAGPMRWLAIPVVSGSRRLGVMVAVVFTAGQEDALRSTVVTVSTVTVLILLAACLIAWGAAGRALSPVRALAATARSVSDGHDLDARITVERTDEVGDLAASFNEMLDRLQGAFDSQKRFLDDAGHELRTPITIVRGHLELLDADDDPAERQRELDLVLDEVARMERLVDELRLLVRSERPDFLARDDVDLRSFVEDLGENAEVLGDPRWKVSADIEGTLRADRHRLTQAMLNLVSNAVSVTREGTVIELGAERRAGEVVFWVRDEGPGIAPDDLPTIFNRTGRTIDKRAGGTGLGLPIVAAIARAHGGHVSVRSQLGRGATFEVVVPGGPA